MGREPRIALHVDGSRGKEPPVVEIPQPGGEAEAQEIEERNDDFSRPGGIRGRSIYQTLSLVEVGMYVYA